jgi:TerC family integral membrane protein
MNRIVVVFILLIGLCVAFNTPKRIYREISTKPQHHLPFLSYSRIKSSSINAVGEVDSDISTSDFKKTAAWIAAATGFAGAIAATMGPTSAIEFASGYVLEETLSVDNLFVFLLLFDYFKVDKKSESKVLEYGILGAVALRGLFIWLGAEALENFHQVVVLFAAVLFGASYNILFKRGGKDEEENLESNPIVQFAQKFFKSTDHMDDDKFFTMDETSGENVATPLLLCLVCIELSDIVFAFDSVPAIFGVTSDPFIVYTSNMFAILSLRSLYGVLSKAVTQLKYLEKAVGLILAVIGLKLAAGAWNIELLDPLESLLIVLSILSGGIALSLADKGDSDKEETIQGEVLK